MEPLLNPLHDRIVSDLDPPPHRPLERSQLYPRGIAYPPDWTKLRNHLASEGRLSKQDCLLLIRQATDTFRRENNVLELKEPINVIGDIHGQFYDLLQLLESEGDFSRFKHLFLGDYVDRGYFSIEVVLLLYALKLNFKQNIYLLRGNHESRQITSHFNFRSECLHKFDIEIYNAVMESFDALPIACIVNNKFLAVHGGLSPDLVNVQDLSKFNRFTEPPKAGLFCDILWSDPIDHDQGVCPEIYAGNGVRGCAYYFGITALNSFLQKSRLIAVLRAHEVQKEGFKMHRWHGANEFPSVITIFSAPNYCDVYNNKAAILKFENNQLNIQQFNYTAHPYILPDFMLGFEWSLPFIIEKVMEIMENVLKNTSGSEPLIKRASMAGDRVKQFKEDFKDNREEVMRAKVTAINKMIRIFRTVREEQEVILRLKGLCPDNKIPAGLIRQGREALLSAVDSFSKAKSYDLINEKRPD
ncbi:unnamed protein product [Blepharisma stoltei]|uniref:Serine/threonine-protein phosphatase n=1 Tax=Blepharisma stoltei TaxID=1481888 RepID=A0AAU9IE03_9CILI|nr:unnamed protein product [Blepharisma stoltei]